MNVVESDGRVVCADCADHVFRGRLAVFLVPGYRETYHWLMQALPRLHTLVKSGEAYDAIHISDISAQQREALYLAMRKLGIADDKLLYIPEGETVDADAVVDVPVLWRARWPFPSALAEAITFLRGLFEPEINPEWERILVSRKGFDRYEHTARLEALLEPFCYMAEPHLMSFRQQVSMFASARVVVGAIGSGLTNIVFARPGARLIELVHRHYENHVFRALADGSGCSYERMCFN